MNPLLHKMIAMIVLDLIRVKHISPAPQTEAEFTNEVLKFTQVLYKNDLLTILTLDLTFTELVRNAGWNMMEVQRALDHIYSRYGWDVSIGYEPAREVKFKIYKRNNPDRN